MHVLVAVFPGSALPRWVGRTRRARRNRSINRSFHRSIALHARTHARTRSHVATCARAAGRAHENPSPRMDELRYAVERVRDVARNATLEDVILGLRIVGGASAGFVELAALLGLLRPVRSDLLAAWSAAAAAAATPKGGATGAAPGDGGVGAPPRPVEQTVPRDALRLINSLSFMYHSVCLAVLSLSALCILSEMRFGPLFRVYPKLASFQFRGLLLMVTGFLALGISAMAYGFGVLLIVCGCISLFIAWQFASIVEDMQQQYDFSRSADEEASRPAAMYTEI